MEIFSLTVLKKRGEVPICRCEGGKKELHPAQAIQSRKNEEKHQA